MIELFFSIFVVTVTIYGQGLIFNKIISRQNILITNFFELSIFGIFFLSFSILFINFFTPIGKPVGTAIIIFSLLFFLNEMIKNANRKIILKKIFIVCLISFLLVAYSNIYRPDAGLYHLPYINILHENKIIIGLANIHHRFAHISILQYLSAAFNNFLIPIESISIPTSLIYSFFSYFVFSSLRKLIKKKKIIETTPFFFIFIISVYSYNRFSEYGNDAPGHLFFLILFIYIISKDIKKNFSTIVLISTFLFLIKPFFLILFFLIVYLFFSQKDKIKLFKDKKIIFSVFFLFLWLIKNIFVSGCVIYPISKLCIKNFVITDFREVTIQESSGEAWSKDWPNYKEKKYNMADYSKKFRWIETWSNNHLHIVFEKLIPIIIFLTLIYLLFFLKKNFIRKNKFNLESLVYFLLFLFFVIIWFVKFPIYRYGSSFIIVFLVYIVILISNKFVFNDKDQKEILLIYNIFIVIALVAFLGKNSLRIYKNYETKNIYPNINNLDENNAKNLASFKKISINNSGYYYHNISGLCMYGKSPCTSYKISNIYYKELYHYKIFYKKRDP